MNSFKKKIICITCPDSEVNTKTYLGVSIGMTCGQFMKDTDKTCGCILALKTVLPGFDCPQKKWNDYEYKHSLALSLNKLMRKYRLEDGSLIKTNCPKENLTLLTNLSKNKFNFLEVDVLRSRIMDEGYGCEIIDRSDIKPK